MNNEKIELAVANCLPTERTYGINAKNSKLLDVTTLAESFSKVTRCILFLQKGLILKSFFYHFSIVLKMSYANKLKELLFILPSTFTNIF